MFKENKAFKNKGLTKIITIFVLSLFIMTLTGCSSELDYEDFANDHIIGMDNIIEQSDTQYLVYYYGLNCSHCQKIKKLILNFALDNDVNINVYFIVSALDNDSKVINNPSYITDPITGVPMTGTPTVITVVNRRVVDLSVGPTIITDLLEQIEVGSYGFFD